MRELPTAKSTTITQLSAIPSRNMLLSMFSSAVGREFKYVFSHEHVVNRHIVSMVWNERQAKLEV